MIHSILPVQFTCLTVFCTTSLQVVFGKPLGLAPSTSYSMHFFTQLLSSLHNTCPSQCSLFCCSTEIMSSNPILSFSTVLGTQSFALTSHIHSHLCPLKCHLIFFSHRPGLTSMQYTTLCQLMHACWCYVLWFN